MKKSIFRILSVAILSSCTASSHTVEIDDIYKEIKSTKLVQVTKAFSETKEGEKTNRSYYTVTSTYLYEEKKNERPIVTVDFQIFTPVRPDEIDSVMFFNLDNEKIRIVSDKYKFKKSSQSSTSSTSVGDQVNTISDNSYQLMNREFTIPENLWTPIANAETIQCRLYLGKEGIDIKPKPADLKKLKSFFSLAVNKLSAKFPAIPEGRKKW